MKSIARTLTNTLLFFIFVSTLSAQDTLKLVGGEIKVVNISTFNSESISFYEMDGENKKEYTIPMNMVDQVIRFGNVKFKAPYKLARHAIYLELGGPGGFASINYDMRIRINEKLGVGARVGAGGFVSILASASFSIMEVNMTLLRKNHYIVLGLGKVRLESTLLFSETETKNGLLLDIGYRHMPPSHGFFFQASINPVFYNDGQHTLPIGVSFGFVF